jgi:hypothetical protein
MLMHPAAIIYDAQPMPSWRVWRPVDYADRKEGVPNPHFTSTLEGLGDRTRCTLIVRFRPVAVRDAAVGIGFTGPIEASNDRLTDYLKVMREEHFR